MSIRPWRERYEEDQDSNEDGIASFSSDSYMQDEIDELRNKVEALEAMRPHWAKGYTSDSVAAQGQTSALSQVWEALGVNDQTACILKLRALITTAGDFESTVEHMNEGCVCGRAPAPKNPVDPRLLTKPKKKTQEQQE
ncbi:hypothetical protein [Pseudomonas tolaasii]